MRNRDAVSEVIKALALDEQVRTLAAKVVRGHAANGNMSDERFEGFVQVIAAHEVQSAVDALKGSGVTLGDGDAEMIAAEVGDFLAVARREGDEIREEIVSESRHARFGGRYRAWNNQSAIYSARLLVA